MLDSKLQIEKRVEKKGFSNQPRSRLLLELSLIAGNKLGFGLQFTSTVRVNLMTIAIKLFKFQTFCGR